MKPDNVKYLVDRLEDTGVKVDPQLRKEIETKVGTGVSSFSVDRQYGVQHDKADVSYIFNRGKESNLYFFNEYKVTAENNGKLCIKTYSTSSDQDKKINLEDAIKLTQGKSIRQPQKNSFIQLDLYKRTPKGEPSIHVYNSNYGGDTQHALRQYPIIDLDKHLAQYTAALEKGETLAVPMQVGDKKEDYKIDYNAKFKSLDVYDPGTGVKLPLEEMQALKNSNRGSKQGAKEAVAKEQTTVGRAEKTEITAPVGSQIKRRRARRLLKLHQRVKSRQIFPAKKK